jgi:hypothetical protein
VRAARLCDFLRFAIETSAQGREGDLKEYVIALEVFHRPDSYDPKIDSVVRVEAAKLRSKLERYYQTEGRNDPLRIEIPKGGEPAPWAETNS